MPIIAAFIMSYMMFKLAVKIMAVLGLAVLTYGALISSFEAIKQVAVDQYAALPAASLQLLSLASIDAAVGLVLGALVARVSFIAITRVATGVGL